MTTIQKLTRSGRHFEALKVPHLFTAPASFLALPVESMFKFIKLTDFRERTLSDRLKVTGRSETHLTHKEHLLAQISDFLSSMSPTSITKIYHERLRHLRVFLGEERV